jgi:hemolysin III
MGEEIANVVTHGLGAVLSGAALALLVVFAVQFGDVWHIVSSAVFGTMLVVLYTASTVYHAVPSRGKHVAKIIDHASIYLLIAGTYTPFTLVSLRGPIGWSVFGVEWGLALAGVLSKSIAMERFKQGRLAILSALVYLLQGWLAIFVIKPFLHAVGWHCIAWMGAGGLAYTLGIVFFALDSRRYFHAAWHIFVLAGSIAHYFAILFYVLPVRQ